MKPIELRLPQSKIYELIKNQQESVRELNQIILEFEQDIVAAIVDPLFVEHIEDYANALLDLAETIITARRTQTLKEEEDDALRHSSAKPICLPPRSLL